MAGCGVGAQRWFAPSGARPGLAERIFQDGPARAQPWQIQTIHADIARPTPAAGWENAESLALLPRLVKDSSIWC